MSDSAEIGVSVPIEPTASSPCDRHRRHQDAAGLPGCSRRPAGDRAATGWTAPPCSAAAGRSSSTICVLLQPFPVGMALGERRLELLVGNEPAFVEVDQQHLAGLQPPLGDDVLLRDRQHAHLGGHDDAVVAGDEVARGAQAVAVERGADLAAVGEGDRGRAVPRLHQRGVVFVEGAPLLVHERIARPGLRNHHHHGVRERVAALHQEFERVVEAGGVGLAFVGDRPELVDVVAEQRRRHRRLPRRHPVVVAAQRVDLAVVRDHPVGMRERPGREGVGREALVHQRERALEIRVVQVRDSRCRAGRPGTCPCRRRCGRRSTPGNSPTAGARGANRSVLEIDLRRM